MDVRLSAEQIALRDSASRLLRDLGPQVVADLDDDQRRTKLDAAVAASGWREMRAAADADSGSAAASSVDAAIVVEQAGRGLADVPLLGPILAADLRRLVGAPASSELETVLLWRDLGALGMVDDATLATEGLVAVDAGGVTTAIVLAGAGPARRLARANLSAPHTRPDLTRSLATAAEAATALDGLDSEHLTDENSLRWNALGLALACADLVGVMDGATRLATEYAKLRHQYGVAVGSFQALQHLLADALVSVEGSRSVALYAAWAVDAAPPAEALTAARLAKAYCARAARGVCETAIQVHGGIGNTWDCLAHVYLRRALLSTEILGGVGPSLEHVLNHHGLEP